MTADVLDLFAGPGGWSVALAGLGLTEYGVEWDEDTCRTARRAGHHRHHGDVRYLRVTPGQYAGLIASPPCQTFSQAGSGEGREYLDILVTAAELVAARMTPQDALASLAGAPTREVAPLGFEWDRPTVLDERSALVLEPLRVALALRPRWVALEQVPAVLPIWQAVGGLLHVAGYSVATGVLSAEQYGVPQTRRRAVLVASRVRDVELPRPTHSRYYSASPERLDPGVLPWVSMADALGWSVDDTVGFPRLADGGSEVDIDGTAYRARDLRPADRPAQAVTEKARSWTRFNDQSGTPFDPMWPAKRPATTIAGRGIVPNPGVNANRFNGSSKSRNDGVRVSVAEAGVLQAFPADYPWTGSESAQYQQVGDAVPPPLAAAIIRAAADGVETVCTECGNDIATEGYELCSECLEATS